MRIVAMHDLASTVKGRRLSLDRTQADVAAEANVSRQWLSAFERGKPTAEFEQVLRLLPVLGLELRVEEATPRPPDTFDLDAWLNEYNDR